MRNIGTYWVAASVKNDEITYFDGFGVEHLPKEIKKFIGNKDTIAKIHRIQAYDSIRHRYVSIGFISFMLNNKSFADFTYLFLPNSFNQK